ncbi:MAG TPA: SDR family NAD(P)-dependent oxidoreductase [Burkholderiales bacterium]|nr:SDR family NAD(P)-dependent oxidoreductase [Burkholderiales bacterium]
MNSLDMNGRSAIVTGGASGIGLAIVQRLAQSGANVSIWDMNEKTMADAAKSISGAKIHTAKVDVSRLADVEAAMNATVGAFGKVDALVNSAGVAGKNAMVWEYPVDEWLRVHDINLNGTFYTCRTVAAHMMKNSYGRIVNIASIAGKEGNPTASAYSSSKAAVIALTKSLGKELAKNGITVNCVTPAAVKTPIFEQVAQSHIDFMLSKIPMGRFGLVEEIAAMVAWMCTEDCSFTTGAVFDLSGGRATY